MAEDLLARDDLSAYVIAGVPRSFKRKLQKFVEQEAKSDAGVMLLDEDMTDWLMARLRGEKRREWETTPASAAIWRAYRALSAARYHLRFETEREQQIRELRRQIEALWHEVSPLGTPVDDVEGDAILEEQSTTDDDADQSATEDDGDNPSGNSQANNTAESSNGDDDAEAASTDLPDPENEDSEDSKDDDKG